MVRKCATKDESRSQKGTFLTLKYCTYGTIADKLRSNKATFTHLRNLMRNFSTFLLACLLYFTFGPKSFVHRWTVY